MPAQRVDNQISQCNISSLIYYTFNIFVTSVFHNKKQTSNFKTIKSPPSGRHTVIYMLANAKSEHGGSSQLSIQPYPRGTGALGVPVPRGGTGIREQGVGPRASFIL